MPRGCSRGSSRRRRRSGKCGRECSLCASRPNESGDARKKSSLDWTANSITSTIKHKRMSLNEAFSRVLIDEALKESGWDLLDSRQVRLELHTATGRADYVLLGPHGPLCVLEAKREDA